MLEAELARCLKDEALALTEAKRYREALERIANTDYRGNRSTESQIAWEALNRG